MQRLVIDPLIVLILVRGSTECRETPPLSNAQLRLLQTRSRRAYAHRWDAAFGMIGTDRLTRTKDPRPSAATDNLKVRLINLPLSDPGMQDAQAWSREFCSCQYGSTAPTDFAAGRDD
jgi:hypothetical protein